MKKKGSLAALALICSIIFLSIGLWFGSRHCDHLCCVRLEAPDCQQLQVAPVNQQLQVVTAPPSVPRGLPAQPAVPAGPPPGGRPGKPPGGG
jgi:hypothetical protein